MDDALRELERLAALGDPGAIERLEAARRRAGLGRTPIVVPALGDSVTEVTLAEWFVGPGDRVRRDQVIATLDSDKVSVDLVSPDDGVVAEIAVSPGAAAQVGETLAQLGPPPPPDPALEARHDALLAAVVAAPDDVAARLAYAELLLEAAALGRGIRPWGAETTRVRGELIRLHHLGAGALSAAEVAWLRLNQGPSMTRTALDLVPGEVQRPRVEGGFLVGVDAPGAWVCQRWGTLVERAPLTALGLRDVDDAAAVLALPRLEQVRSLSLGPRVTVAALEALASSGRLRLRRLVLRSVEPVASLATLGASELHVRRRAPPPWLARSTVERLELDLDVPTEADLRALLDAIPPSVREVAARARVGGAFLTDAALRALIGSRHAPFWR